MNVLPALLWAVATLAFACAGLVCTVRCGIAWRTLHRSRHAVGAFLWLVFAWASLTANPLAQWGLAGLHAARLDACRTEASLVQRYGEPARLETSGGGARLTYHVPSWQIPWRSWETYALVFDGRIIAAYADDL